MPAILLELLFLAAFAVGLYELRRMATPIENPPPPPALDFELVMTRYRQVQPGDSREKVEARLGPPTERNAWGPDIKELEDSVTSMGKEFYPRQRAWDRWSDPQDQGRWVVVLYTGQYKLDKVWSVYKQGF